MTRLSGRVPETGTAISGATVAIIDTQGTDDTTQWSIVASDTTDANGEWSVSGLEPSAVERYHAVAQFDSGVEFVNFESLPFLSTPADAFAPTTPVNVGTPTAEVGIPAFFDVTITNTNTPVDEGDILTVDFSANNTGTFQDTQDIRLEIDNVEEDRDNNVTLDGGVSTTGTLQWDTTNETPAQYTATVLSNDDADSVTVQVESAIPDSGIARWTFDTADINGSTVTNKFGASDLELNGVTTGVSGANKTYTTNEAGDFDGVDDFGNATNVPAFDTPNGFSIAFWYNFDTVTGGPVIAARRNDEGDYSWEAGLDTIEDVMFLRVNDNSNLARGDGSGFATGEWLHYCGTYNGSTIRVYLDGTETGSQSYSATVQTNDADITIGARANVSAFPEFSDAKIDDVRFYSRALSATEVSNLYNTGSIL